MSEKIPIDEYIDWDAETAEVMESITDHIEAEARLGISIRDAVDFFKAIAGDEVARYKVASRKAVADGGSVNHKTRMITPGERWEGRK